MENSKTAIRQINKFRLNQDSDMICKERMKVLIYTYGPARIWSLLCPHEFPLRYNWSPNKVEAKSKWDGIHSKDYMCSIHLQNLAGTYQINVIKLFKKILKDEGLIDNKAA
jgi:hypothetical protein